MRLLVASALLLVSTDGLAQPPTLDGCAVLPQDNIWNAPIDSLPVDARSAQYIASIGADVGLHPDFGAGLWEGASIGIPFVTVSAGQPGVPIQFTAYGDESDPGPYPVPPGAPVEGGPDGDGDRHVLVLDRDACRLYELYRAFPNADGSWDAESGAIYDLASHALRPRDWTSADAAGLPILPGLARYDEVAAGEIPHALRFTAPRTRRSWVWPARHFASSSTDLALPPMGQRFRLKAAFDVSAYPPQVQVILRALKKYGMILADNGSAWYISGAPDPGWDDDALVSQLRKVKGSDFEAVDVSSLQVDPDSGQARVLDYGDAPEPAYKTLAASGGASHLAGSLRLGATVDAERDGQPHAGAQGDDLNGDDEDGVTFTSALTAGGVTSVQVTASAAGQLDAWLDWNRDGDWNDLDEQVFTARPVAAGAQYLSLTVPGSAAPGTTFARFRLSSAGGLDPWGPAPDGEVEDQAVSILGSTGSLTLKAPNSNVNWAAGGVQRIQWTHSLGASGRVRIELDRQDDGVFEEVIAAEAPNASSTSGSYDWLVAGPNTAAARVRVSDAANPAVSDAGNTTFRIAVPFVTVSSPNTAQDWGIGGVQPVTWTHNLGIGSKVKVELNRDYPSGSWQTLKASLTHTSGTAGSFNWTVAGPATGKARIRVSTLDGAQTDLGNKSFTISATLFLRVTQPNTALSLAPGSKYSIQWTHNLGTASALKVELNRNYPGGAWETIKSPLNQGSGTGGSFKWTVTGPATTNARVRVSTLDNAVSDQSDTSFTIAP